MVAEANHLARRRGRPYRATAMNNLTSVRAIGASRSMMPWWQLRLVRSETKTTMCPRSYHLATNQWSPVPIKRGETKKLTTILTLMKTICRQLAYHLWRYLKEILMSRRLRWLSRPGRPNSKLIATTTVTSSQGQIKKLAPRLPFKASRCLTDLSNVVPWGIITSFSSQLLSQLFNSHFTSKISLI